MAGQATLGAPQKKGAYRQHGGYEAQGFNRSRFARGGAGNAALPSIERTPLISNSQFDTEPVFRRQAAPNERGSLAGIMAGQAAF